MKGDYLMSKALLRRTVEGILSMVLGLIATYLAIYITNKLLGQPGEDET
jgi:hypothetical protein